VSAEPAEQIVSKGGYARLRGVSAARVSQWLSEGKINGEALVGDGRNAQIRIDVADAQLRVRLDPKQRFGLNGLATRLPDAGDELPMRTAFAPPQPKPDGFDQRMQDLKAREIELRVQEKTEQALARRGTYVRAAEVRAGLTRVAAGMLGAFEGGLADLATEIAAEAKVEQRVVLHALRRGFRNLRAKAADACRRNAAQLPGLAVDELAEVDAGEAPEELTP
jgi:hypothetical protein